MSSKEKKTFSNHSDQKATKHTNVDPNLDHFMGISTTAPPPQSHTAFLFNKRPVSYNLYSATKEDNTRVLTVFGRHAFLDGEMSSLSTCHESNKILAEFASSEVAIQLFPDQTGGSGLIRSKGIKGAPTTVEPFFARTEHSMVASVAVQQEDRSWVENWANLVVSSDENGQPKATIIMTNRPDEKIPVAVVGGATESLGFEIFLGSAVTSNGGYLEGKLSMTENGFQGKMYLQAPNPKYDSDTKGSLKFNYIEVEARAKWNNSDLEGEAVSLLQTNLGTAPKAVDVHHPDALWRKLATETEMSVGELMGMTPPTNADLHHAVSEAMMNCALLAVSPEWLDDLKIAKPAALSEVKAIATDPKNQAFFIKYFKAMGCSELDVAQMQEGWATLPHGWQTVKSRMHYFWQGGAKGCLASDKDFLRISEAVAQIYFANMMRAFQRYLDLPQAQRTKWAEELLAGVTTPQMLMRLTSSKECGAIHKYIIMFNALDKKGGFDKKFTKKINGAIQTQVARRLGSADFKSVEEFLLRVLQQLVDPESALKGAIFDKLREDLNELKEKDPAKWVALTNSTKDLAVELANIALAYKNAPWQQRLKVWRNRILQRYQGDEHMVRVYSEVGSLALTTITVGFATFALVGEIKEWSNLNDLQKATTVLSAVQQVGTLGDQLVKFIKFIREPREPVSTEMDLFSWSGDWDVLPEDALGSEAYELRMAANADNFLKYDIAVFAGPLEALTVVVTVLSMVSLGFQINNDIENGESPAVIVFDVLEEVAMFASILVLPAMAANPILGAVVAIVGIIISFIDSFIPRKPPHIIIWAQDVGTPFVITIPDPPKGWEQKTQNRNLRVYIRDVYPIESTNLPSAVRNVFQPRYLAVDHPQTNHSNASLISLLSNWHNLLEDQKKVVAESIWKSIQSVMNVSDSTMADCLIAQVATSKSAGPAFFYASSPKNMVNGKDYTDEFNDIGIWVMGYAISSNQYFKNVDGAACKAKLMPTFQNKVLASDLFLDYLYKTGGFESFLKYEKPQTKIAVINLILSPGFVPEAFWQHAGNLFPCQVLLLVANDLGCDLTEVRKRIKEWNINPAVFDMADGSYNFFQDFLKVPDTSFFDYIDSNQDIQNGLASNRPKPAGVNRCNVLAAKVWGTSYTGAGGFGVFSIYQDVNGIFGEPVAKWISATSELPHTLPAKNVVVLQSQVFIGNSVDPFPVNSPYSPSQVSSCFPGDAQVMLSTWVQVPVSSLRHGDRVLTLNKKGQYAFSEVFFLGHKEHTVVAKFKKIRMEDGRFIRLSAGHYLPVSSTTSWRDTQFARACDVSVGQLAWVFSEGHNTEPRPSRIISVEDCDCIGLFNPYTLDNSRIIVDNVVASTHSDWFLEGVVPTPWLKYIPYVYDACMGPGKLIYRIMGPKWAEALQEEVEIDKASYEETGVKALVKPYVILIRKVLYCMMKNIWARYLEAGHANKL